MRTPVVVMIAASLALVSVVGGTVPVAHGSPASRVPFRSCWSADRPVLADELPIHENEVHLVEAVAAHDEIGRLAGGDLPAFGGELRVRRRYILRGECHGFRQRKHAIGDGVRHANVGIVPVAAGVVGRHEVD